MFDPWTSRRLARTFYCSPTRGPFKRQIVIVIRLIHVIAFRCCPSVTECLFIFFFFLSSGGWSAAIPVDFASVSFFVSILSTGRYAIRSAVSTGGAQPAGRRKERGGKTGTVMLCLWIIIIYARRVVDLGGEYYCKYCYRPITGHG